MIQRLLIIFFLFTSFLGCKKRAPIEGNNINDERIGKFIILQSKKLVKQKNQVASQMHTGIYNHFEIYLLLKSIF